jgi:proteasome lid subunit RPN8/RPN11
MSTCANYRNSGHGNLEGNIHNAVGRKNSYTIEKHSWDRILRHTISVYPQEACGILLCPRDMPYHIIEAHPTKNVTLGDPANRYFVDPVEFIEADEHAEQKGFDICGFYHSHPDHTPIPSDHDRKLAWESYLYLIISVIDGSFNEAGTWIFEKDRRRFKKSHFSIT